MPFLRIAGSIHLNRIFDDFGHTNSFRNSLCNFRSSLLSSLYKVLNISLPSSKRRLGFPPSTLLDRDLAPSPRTTSNVRQYTDASPPRAAWPGHPRTTVSEHKVNLVEHR